MKIYATMGQGDDFIYFDDMLVGLRVICPLPVTLSQGFFQFRLTVRCFGQQRLPLAVEIFEFVLDGIVFAAALFNDLTTSVVERVD